MINQKSKALVMNHVELKLIPPVPNGGLTERILRKCAFCQKGVVTSGQHEALLRKLSGPDAVFCSFCLRHGLNTANARHVMLFSLRGIFGHYYYELAQGQNKKLAVSEVEDFVETHRQVGLLNPVLKYDDDMMVWFADFDKVGNGRKQIPLDEILKSVVNMLACLDLYALVPEVSPSILFEKYKDGIKLFYSRRKLPGKERLLSLSLRECGIIDRKNSPDKSILFNRACLLQSF